MTNLCLSGDFCAEEAVESSIFPGMYRFCRRHQEQLDLVAGRLEEVRWRNNIRNKTTAEERFCATLGCDNRPLYTSDYCAQCNGGD